MEMATVSAVTMGKLTPWAKPFVLLHTLRQGLCTTGMSVSWWWQTDWSDSDRLGFSPHYPCTFPQSWWAHSLPRQALKRYCDWLRRQSVWTCMWWCVCMTVCVSVYYRIHGYMYTTVCMTLDSRCNCMYIQLQCMSTTVCIQQYIIMYYIYL